MTPSKKTSILFSLFLVFGLSAIGQVTSPQDFLGYELGEKFTRHHRIVEYTSLVQSQIPAQSRIIKYGFTSEDRPLEVIVLGSEANIENLETIRKNQIDQISGIKQPSKNDPIIVWLSYNVHGNEASSSEAYMKVLYDIAANPAKFLNGEMVLILDPCINPDGRDRYTNWYNIARSNKLNLDHNSREHHEPWPQGRTNHYGYDLNRDWVWQTQKESQQRMALYHEWMPHIHADFHEMGAEDSYYFPPAAKPFHKAITPWQRSFQQTLGVFIRQSFDANGWSYFTKENYDLLYPSYGDTYPIYNGAIGMTLEQGGSSRAGLAYVKKNSDTLTLKDRLTHHHATSFQIIAAAQSENDQLKSQFYSFFNDARNNGVGDYKGYLIKNSDERRLNSLTALLDKLQINYAYAKEGTSINGFDFSSKSEKNLKTEKGDVFISTKQTKGLLAHVLLEPSTFVEDSNTYDITAWSLPYVFNLEALGLNSQIPVDEKIRKQNSKLNYAKDAYAYLVKWNHINDASLLADLHKAEIPVEVQLEAFQISKQSYPPGTLVIKPKNTNRAKIVNLLEKHQISAEAIYSGMVSSGPDLGSGSIAALQAPKIGLIMGEGTSTTAVGDIWHYFDEVLDYPISLLETSYFNEVDIWDYTTIIATEGKYKELFNNTETIERWIKDGGNLILIENAASIALDQKGFDLSSKKSINPTLNEEPIPYGNRRKKSQDDMLAGAIFKVKMDASHPLGFGYKDNAYFLIHEKPNLDLLKDGWNVGYLEKNAHMAGIAGKNILNESVNSLIFGVESKGKGNVVYLNTNPVFRGFWHEGKLLLANAIFMVN